MNKKILNNTKFLIWTFLILYLPPLTKIPMIVLLGVISWIYLFANHKTLAQAIDIEKAFIIQLVLFILVVYVSLVGLIHNREIAKPIIAVLYMDIFSIPIVLAYIVGSHRAGYEINELIKFIILAAFLQGCLAIGTYLSDGLQNVTVHFLYNCMDSGFVDIWRKKRLYGLATGMTYAMPVVQGLIASITLIYSIKREFKYILFIPFIISAGIFNARTSMVVLCIGIIGTVSAVRFKTSEFRKLLFLIIGIVLVLGFLLYVASIMSNGDSFTWLRNGFKELYFFIVLHERIGYFSSWGQSYNSVKIPENLLFGEGDVKVRTDIGYIRDLWLGGILYAFSIYSVIIYLIYKAYKRIRLIDRKIGNAFVIVVTFTLVVCGIKGQALAGNEMMNLIWMAMLYYTCNRKKIMKC